MFKYVLPAELQHDDQLITSLRLPGIAACLGLPGKHSDLDMWIANLDQAERLSYSRRNSHKYQNGVTTARVIACEQVTNSAGLSTGRRSPAGTFLRVEVKGRLMGWQSDAQATPKLREALQAYGQAPIHVDRKSVVYKERGSRSIIDKKPSQKDVMQMGRVTEMLRSAAVGLERTGAIDLGGGKYEFEHVNEKGEVTRSRVRLSDPWATKVYGPSNRLGGRFYHCYQNIPKEERVHMTINGYEVCELDFRALHPTLLYAIRGAPMEGDPYDVPGFDRNTEVKLGMLIMLNAKDMRSCIAALSDKRTKPGLTRDRAIALTEAIRKRHPAIADAFCSDAGISLMNTDSAMAGHVTDALIRQGIPSFSNHDSFVVPVKYEGQAREAMASSWRAKKLDVSYCNITVKRAKNPKSSHSMEGA